ncbi:hypothetical protein B0H11DRAFT_1907389 [Mycena galericulata]|nr:hypothetical protein B0H11DRAFT_1907389 [Mycena galericulata]
MPFADSNVQPWPMPTRAERLPTTDAATSHAHLTGPEVEMEDTTGLRNVAFEAPPITTLPPAPATPVAGPSYARPFPELEADYQQRWPSACHHPGVPLTASDLRSSMGPLPAPGGSAMQE